MRFVTVRIPKKKKSLELSPIEMIQDAKRRLKKGLHLLAFFELGREWQCACKLQDF
jgi:uncharacterized protein YggL (DUF469 family)